MRDGKTPGDARQRRDRTRKEHGHDQHHLGQVTHPHQPGHTRKEHGHDQHHLGQVTHPHQPGQDNR
jgi:hypothetical protein